MSRAAKLKMLFITKSFLKCSWGHRLTFQSSATAAQFIRSFEGASGPSVDLRVQNDPLSSPICREVESAFLRRPVHLSSKPAAGMAPGSALREAVKQYGTSEFSIDAIDYVSLAISAKKVEHYIDYYRTMAPAGYNTPYSYIG